ncbi:YhfC family intramembrane metalloprotease [Virgibacillus sp. NKC19-3]|nr:YhfC family intramembrane metalloprotease [Virgibacillus sp. NKC19-3]
MIIRIPLISLFDQTSIGLDLQFFYPVIYVFILGITASLFEEYGRWFMMKFPLKTNLPKIISFSLGCSSTSEKIGCYVIMLDNFEG